MNVTFELIEKDALEKLHYAKVVSAKVSKAIDSVEELLEIQDNEMAKIQFTINAVDGLMAIFNLMKNKIETKIDDYENKKTVIISDILGHVTGLKQICDELITTKVDTGLNDSDKNLYDFIDDGSLDRLINEVNKRVDHIKKIPSPTFINSIIMRLNNEEKYILQEWEDIQSNYSKQLSTSAREKQLKLLLENNSVLEYEQVNILQGLNEHWDKCALYHKNPTDELWSVLKEDYIDLPTIISTLEKNSNIILQNCKDIERFVKAFNNTKTNITTFLIEVSDFTTEVLTKQIKNDLLMEWQELDTQFSLLETYKEEIIEYQTDCTLFVDSYYKLILEVNRRKTMDREIRSLVNDFQTRLQAYINADENERSKFMEENADFIPQNLVTNMLINSGTPQISIHYESDPLPQLSSSTIRNASEKLSSQN